MNDPAIFGRRERLWLVGLFVGGGALRVLHVLTVRDTPFFQWLMLDPRMYDQWAQRIAAGEWIGERPFFQDPLYPYLLGCVYRLLGHAYTPVVLGQALFGATVAPLVFATARRPLGFAAAAIAGGLAAGYRPSIYYEGMILKTALATWLVALGFWMLSRRLVAGRSGGARDLAMWVAVGLTFGLATLARGNVLLFLPMLAVWIWIDAPVGVERSRRGRLGDRRAQLTALALVVGAILAIGPVALRNRVVGEEWILTTSNAGQNFYIGNNPNNASGQYEKVPFVDANPKFEERGFAREAEARARRAGRLGADAALLPGEVSRFWFGQSLEWIRAEPGAWLRLTWRKLRVFWGAYEVPDNLDYYLYREAAPILRLPLPGFGFVAPLGLFGGMLLWRRPGLPRCLLLFLLVYSSSVVLFFVFSRFRMPLMPVLFLFAGHAVAESWQRLRAANAAGADRAPWVHVASLLLLFAFVNVPVRARPESLAFRVARALGLPRQPETSAQGHFNLGVSFAAQAKGDDEAGRLLELAEQELRAAIDAGAPFAAPHVELGKVLARQHRNDEAIVEYRIAATLEPGNYRHDHAIGLLERRRGDLKAAEAAFRRALAAEPRHVASAVQLGEVLLETRRRGAAVAAFRHALNLNPGSARARRGLAAAGG